MKAVLFDLDDTLFAERDFVASGLTAAAAWAAGRAGLNGEDCRRELLRLAEDGPRGRVFDAWLESRALPAAWAAEMVASYREHVPAIRPDPAAPALLERLAGRFALGLVSDGYLAVQRRKWGALGLDRWFGCALFTDELGRERWKPCPDGYRLVLERLGVEAAEAVYVGDNPAKDFLGARRAGLRSIRLRRPGGVYAGLEPTGPDEAPDLDIARLDDLEPALTALGLLEIPLEPLS